MTDLTNPPSIIGNMRSNWGWLLALGIAFVVAGLFAVAMPFISSLTVTIVVAVALVFAGIVQIVQAFSMRSWTGFIWQLVIGIVALIGGIAIYINPAAGALALTVLVAAVFLAKGIFQIVLGFRVRALPGSGWVIAAGVIAFLVGLMIISDWPFSGTYALGILAGVSLAFTGWSYVAIALAIRRF
jgi:uncharacterized membrane protein HdeD (DUF308 family)